MLLHIEVVRSSDQDVSLWSYSIYVQLEGGSARRTQNTLEGLYSSFGLEKPGLLYRLCYQKIDGWMLFADAVLNDGYCSLNPLELCLFEASAGSGVHLCREEESKPAITVHLFLSVTTIFP